jgi:hypothetical protein
MGAGKGKSRRTQAAPPAAKTRKQSNARTVQYSRLGWDLLVGTSARADMTLSKYCFGEDLETGSNETFEKMHRKLFADAVKTGTISLPVPYSADDFEIRITTIPSHPDGIAHTTIALKAEPEYEGSLGSDDQIALDDSLGGEYLHAQLRIYAIAAGEIIQARRSAKLANVQLDELEKVTF